MSGASASPESRLASAVLAGDSIESLLALHGRRRPWIYWVVLLACLGGLALLPVIQVDVMVRAPAMVRPATERVELRAPLGGRIARMHARENEVVSSGQALIEIATADLDERLARQAALLAEKETLQADLLALCREFSGNLRPDTSAQMPAPIITAALSQERSQLLMQAETIRLAAERARVELSRVSALQEKGLATRRELDDARYALERAQADGRLAEQQAVTRWAARQREEQLASQQIESERKRLMAERALAVVRAPVAGAVQGFQGWADGAFLSAGQSLGAISPDASLLVEALVSPRDIGHLRVGQAARMQIDAYAYTQWGLLDGVVTAIGADATTGGATGAPPFFKVTVRPSAPELRLPTGTRGELRRGMTASARFLVARRTLLEVLWGDAASWLNPQEQGAMSR
jgi:multidrug resistance efflux pump